MFTFACLSGFGGEVVAESLRQSRTREGEEIKSRVEGCRSMKRYKLVVGFVLCDRDEQSPVSFGAGGSVCYVIAI